MMIAFLIVLALIIIGCALMWRSTSENGSSQMFAAGFVMAVGGSLLGIFGVVQIFVDHL